MSKKIRIRINRPAIGYPGSMLQNTYSEDLKHFWLKWEFKSSNDFTVVPVELPNPKPFLTIDWNGSVNKTVDQLKNFKAGSRVRIKSDAKIPLKYSTKLVSTIKNEMGASEVIFKEEQATDISRINMGSVQLLRTDLRNSDVLFQLLKEHYKSSEMHEDEWVKIYDLLRKYVSILTSEDVMRNVKWSLRRLRFNNMYSYGEDNTINFDALSGLVGIFGPNRSGKSSILGTLMYGLFNATDRGPIKNMLLCNTRKQSCSSKIVIKLGGRDYLVERSTNKKSNKQGDISAATNLRIWELIDGKPVESTGEQRSDTEKTLRKLIGTSDDFHLMSISTQRDDNSILEHGSTKRRQIISRFLDIDVLQQIHELARDDVREQKGLIKNLNEDLNESINDRRNVSSNLDQQIELNVSNLESSRERLFDLKTQLAAFKGFKHVSIEELESHRESIDELNGKLSKVVSSIEKAGRDLQETDEKIERVSTVLQDYDLVTMKQQLDSFKKLRSSVNSMLQAYTNENNSFERSKKTIKILQDVPCGDSFPTCKFIKDAHDLKPTLDDQRDRVNSLKRSYDEANQSLGGIDEKKMVDNVSKVESLKEKLGQLKLNKAQLETQLTRLNHNRNEIQRTLDVAINEFEDLESRTDKKKNDELTSLKSLIFSAEAGISVLEKANISLARQKGKIESEIERLLKDQKRRIDILQRMKYHEVIESSFSKNGIQDAILSSMLPAINEEVAKILNGIVNFTVELEKLPNDDQIDIYINYGDGDKRVLELGSGMEKFISSIVLRVALNNISTLPKSDVFFIDEGFGSLDASSVEECSTLLQSLKKYFKTIIVITHVDVMKDIVDSTIEITRNGKDSHVSC